MQHALLADSKPERAERAEREDTFIQSFGFAGRKDKARQRRERKGWKS
jgi:hypothetical protein